MKESKITINATFKIYSHQAIEFEEWMMRNSEVVSFRHLPDTTGLYASNKEYKRIVDGIRKWTDARDEFHNVNNIE